MSRGPAKPCRVAAGRAVRAFGPGADPRRISTLRNTLAARGSGEEGRIPKRPIIPLTVAWLTQSRDDMIQLHKPRERAAGSAFWPGATKVLVPTALPDDPATPRAHPRGVRFCAGGGLPVSMASAACNRAPVRAAIREEKSRLDRVDT